MKHTPGHWNVVGPTATDIQAGPMGLLAYVSTAGGRGRTLAEAQANARLIAAAPDLLAACEKIVRMLGHDCASYKACEMAKAAVAKATEPQPNLPGTLEGGEGAYGTLRATPEALQASLQRIRELPGVEGGEGADGRGAT